MQNCFLSNEILHYEITEITIAFSFQNWTAKKVDELNKSFVLQEEGPLSCTLQLKASTKPCLWFLLQKHACTDPVNVVTVTDSRGFRKRWGGCNKYFPPGFDFVSSSDLATLRIEVWNTAPEYAVLVHVRTGTDAPSNDRLQLRYVTPNSGYIQTPGWDPEDRVAYPTFLESSVSVPVPDNHSLHVQLVYNDIKCAVIFERWLFTTSHQLDWVKVSVTKKGGAAEKKLLEDCYWRSRPYFTESDVDMLHVQFHSDDSVAGNVVLHDRDVDYLYRQHTGFRMLFEFRQDVAEQDVVQPHLPWIPGDVSCMDSWDSFMIGDTCYVNYDLQREMFAKTDLYALNFCQNKGGHPVSFNTLDEWYQALFLARRKDIRSFLIGLRAAPLKWPSYYRYMNKWADDTVAYLPFAISSPLRPYQECYFVPFMAPYARASRCLNDRYASRPQVQILCEFKQPSGAQEKKKEQVPDVKMVDESWARRDLVSVSRCPSGHYVQSFLVCDVKSACWAGRNSVYGREGEGWGVPSPSTCTVSDVTPMPPSFACANGKQHVTYSQVCDFRPDCVDDSDEDFCDYPACSFQDFHCNSRQCVPLASRCDQYVDCYDGSDEDGCGVDILGIYPRTYPAIVDFDAQGIVSLRPLSTSTNSSSSCPAGTHFLCPGKGYCLPVYTRCNGVNDCPGREDEADCESYTCPGFYRCWDSHVCVHPAHLCDGWSQCPHQDDERYCGLRCPDNCTCFAWVFVCPQTFRLEQHRAYLRYLDAGGSGMTLSDVQGCGMLIHLSLARCGLPLLDRVPLPNLNSLTLSDNLLRAVTAADFLLMPSLKVLFLSGNPLQSLFQEILGSAAPVMNLQWLDVSRVQLKRFNVGSLQGAHSVQTLNLSDSSLSTVVGEGFQVFPLLRVLDLRGCPVSAFSLDIFQGLENLDTVDADNPWLCCRHVLPAGFDTSRCSSPSAIVSTCEDLIGQSWHRVVAIVTCAVTCAGNVVSFSLRVLCRWRKPRSAFSVLVSHLSLSDLLLGLHLLVLVVADAVFRGSYVLRDVWWRQGAACSAAGVVWVACSVVSLALLCVLTVHCVWTLYRHTGVLASAGCAHALSAVLWAVGVLVGIFPLLPGARHWEVFSSTALCRPLLLYHRHHHEDGWLFASTVHLVPNLLLGALMAGAGLLIRRKTRHGVINDPALVSDQDQTRVDTCGRMVDIVLINGVCRVVTGVVGLVASLETGVDRDVSVAVSMIVLPLTSALNPCLYLLAVAFGIARKEQHRRLVQILSAQKPKT